MLIEAEPPAHRINVVDQSFMSDHHALRTAGRAGGVDDVGGIAWDHATRRLLVACGRSPIFVEADEARLDPGESARHLPLGEQHCDSCILKNESQALAREFHVDGHVCAAGFEHAEQTDDHLD